MTSLTHVPVVILSAGLTLLQLDGASTTSLLTFQQRVEAQRALERVRYSHQIGARRPFDEAVPESLLEARVRAYLDQSLALERDWNAPITSSMLRDEAERIAADTRMPGRLRELRAALGDDPILIQECLVRPALAGRLIQERVTGVSTVEAAPATLAATCDPAGVWDNRSLGQDNPGPWAGSQHVAAWTGNLMLVWLPTAGSGGRYDPVLDSWSPISTAGAPGPGAIPSAAVAWSGQELLLWGAQSQFGARYEPIADSWSPMSSIGSPSHRRASASVWTGDRLILWGGWDLDKPLNCCVLAYCASCGGQVNTGGMYDPVTDTWTATSTLNAAAPAELSTAVWTGNRMIVFGGYSTYIFYQPGSFKPITRSYAYGGVYDPATDQWSPLPLGIGSRDAHQAAWTGSQMLIWGGSTTRFDGPSQQYVTSRYDTGGAYDPITGIWSPIPAPAFTLSSYVGSSVWTDKAWILWGGSANGNNGAMYDPTLNAWSPTSVVGAPEPRQGASAVWDDSEMLVWGGFTGSASTPTYLSTGGRYIPPDPNDSTDSDQDGFTHCTGDCNESNPAIYPGAAETCDGLDDDCDGALLAAEIDADGDAFSPCLGDCDDSNPSVLPGGLDLPGNLLDEDCSGAALCDSGAQWSNHHTFVRCVSDACGTLVDSGLVSRQECQDIIKAANRSDVGRSHTRRTAPVPQEP